MMKSSPPPTLVAFAIMACCVVVAMPSLLTVQGLPLPTEAQLRYTRGEITALIHFNMATFFQNGDPGCTPANWGRSRYPASFNPTLLDTDNWVESIQALGASAAVLTAKHGCGFCLWPTKAKLPNGTTYGYSVGGPGGIGVDVLKMFQDSCNKAGLGHGFYYSLTNNYYLNVDKHYVQNTTILPGQVKVTQAEFEAIALQQVTELWTEYGQLAEIWFDGGYTSDMKANITALLAKTQPNAAAFNGFGVSPSPLRWDMTELGNPAYPLWSTGCSSEHGDPNSNQFCPATCDTTLQDFDTWFYEPGCPIRSLKTMIGVYHDTVGQNGVLELDFAIDRQGRVNATHAARYKQLGDWVRGCYGTPLANTTASSNSATIQFAQTSVDRVMLQEDQSKGQRVRAFKVEYLASSGAYEPFMSGSSIGNKYIGLRGSAGAVTTTALRLTVTESVGSPVITTFAAFRPCSDGSEVSEW